MALDTSQLTLFGLDLSRVVGFFRVGWQQLLWGEEAGIRSHLDVPVVLLDEQGRRCVFVAGKPVPDGQAGFVQTPEAFEALSLPADDVLFRLLRLPKELESELDDVMALELHSSSPFPVGQACTGWRLLNRDDAELQIVMAIVARADIERHIESRGFNPNNEDALPEIWAMFDDDTPVVIEGFGEQRHYQAYRKRVKYFAARLAALFLLTLALLALPGFVRSLQSDKVEGYLVSAEREAVEAQALRNRLQQANARAQALQELIDGQADYHGFLAHLSAVTPDGVYLQRLEVEGQRIRLNGWADNAGAFMQNVAADAAYDDVRTPSAFSRDPRTGLERFVLDMELAARAPEAGRGAGPAGEGLQND